MNAKLDTSNVVMAARIGLAVTAVFLPGLLAFIAWSTWEVCTQGHQPELDGLWTYLCSAMELPEVRAKRKPFEESPLAKEIGSEMGGLVAMGDSSILCENIMA